MATSSTSTFQLNGGGITTTNDTPQLQFFLPTATNTTYKMEVVFDAISTGKYAHVVWSQMFGRTSGNIESISPIQLEVDGNYGSVDSDFPSVYVEANTTTNQFDIYIKGLATTQVDYDIKVNRTITS